MVVNFLQCSIKGQGVLSRLPPPSWLGLMSVAWSTTGIRPACFMSNLSSTPDASIDEYGEKPESLSAFILHAKIGLEMTNWNLDFRPSSSLRQKFSAAIKPAAASDTLGARRVELIKLPQNKPNTKAASVDFQDTTFM
jgi:hypothetical protein